MTKSKPDELDVKNGGIVRFAQEDPHLGTFGQIFASHVYADEREEPFLVTLTLRDNDGGSLTRQFKVQVSNADPEIFGELGSSAEGQAVTLDALSFFDAGGWIPTKRQSIGVTTLATSRSSSPSRTSSKEVLCRAV